LNIVIVVLRKVLGVNWEVQATPPEPGFAITVHDAIPEKLRAISLE